MASTKPLGSNNPYALRIDTSTNQATTISAQAPKPQRPSESVYLRRLDGTPYEVTPKSKNVVVAKDMYDGQDPPKYESKASYATQRSVNSDIPQNAASCRTCGGQRTAADIHGQGDGQHHDCNKCGKKKMTSPRPSQDLSTVPLIRAVSEGTATALMNASSSNTGVNDSYFAPKKTCHKCGRSKRPATAVVDTRPTSGIEVMPAPPGRHIASQHIMYNVSQGSPLQSEADLRRKPVANSVMSPINTIDIDVIPPTAISERPQPNVLTHPNVDRSPLLESREQAKPRRSTSVSSIASSISRSLSKRRRRSGENTEDKPTHATSNNGEFAAGRLINMITSVIRGNETQDYSRLGKERSHERRPNSPFSFVDKDGEETLELADMKRSGSDPGKSWDQGNVNGSQSEPLKQNPFADPEDLTKRPEPLRVRSDYTGHQLEPHSVQEESDVFLVAPGQRPELTRFKSLRSGVQRAGSVARSTSLRRLNSLKNAPQYWYRDDMSIEGAAMAY